MFRHKNINKLFLDDGETPPINLAQNYGVRINTLAERFGHYWRVLGVYHLSGNENRGNHNCYLECLDDDGKRISGTKFNIRIADSPYVSEAEADKPDSEPAANFPMFSTNKYSVSVSDSTAPSEIVSGLHIMHPDEDRGNTIGHHSFYVVFQRVLGTPTTPLPDEPAEPGQPHPIIEPQPARREIVISGFGDDDFVFVEDNQVIIRLS